MAMSSLQQLLEQRQLWHGRDAGTSAVALSTGWPRLDRELYGAGWPTASLTELLCSEAVLGWQLLLPVLTTLSQQQRLLVWIGQQQAPYAPTWRRAGMQLARCLLVRAGEDEAPWAAEQALRLAQGGAVVLQSSALNSEHLRRLQLAAQTGNSYAFLLRPVSAQRRTTPASLRLLVQSSDKGFQLQVLKRRGGMATAPFALPVPRVGEDTPAPAAISWLGKDMSNRVQQSVEWQSNLQQVHSRQDSLRRDDSRQSDSRQDDSQKDSIRQHEGLQDSSQERSKRQALLSHLKLL